MNFKRGDRIRCRDNSGCYGITIGKIYTIDRVDEWGDFKVKCDSGEFSYYLRSRFVNVIEERKNKLNRLKVVFNRVHI